MTCTKCRFIFLRADSQESDGSHIVFQTSDTSADGDNSVGQNEPAAPRSPTSPVWPKGTYKQ